MIATPPPAIVTPMAAQQEELRTEIKELSRQEVGESFRSVRLRHYIDKIITKNEKAGVTTGVSIIDLQSQQPIIGHNLDTEQFAASVNKVPIAQLVLQDLRSGKLQFDQVLTWTADDVRAGRGVYDQPGAPTQATVEALLFDMLNPSGNTAVRALVNYGLGGAVAVNTRFSGELGLQHTYLQPLDANRFYLGNSTASDSLKVLRQLLATTDTYGAFVKNALVTNVYTDFGVRSQLAGNEFIVLANKVGILDDVDGNNRHDVGIIYNTKTNKAYGYSFMNTAYGEAYNTATAQAGVSLADMGAGLLRYSGDKSTDSAKAFGQNVKPEKKIRY